MRNRRRMSRGWAGSALLSCGPYSSRRHLEYSAAPFRGITQQKEQSRCGGEGPVIRPSFGKVSARAQWRKSGMSPSRRKRAHLRARVVEHSRRNSLSPRRRPRKSHVSCSNSKGFKVHSTGHLLRPRPFSLAAVDRSLVVACVDVLTAAGMAFISFMISYGIPQTTV